MWSPARQWLKPPGTLLIPLFLLTLASVSALIWLGWRFLEQERLVDAQRAQQRLEESADRLVASLRGTLAETADRLTDPAQPITPGALLLLFGGADVSAEPSGQLLFQPSDAVPLPEASAALFAEGEMFEFVRNQPAEAARTYQRLAANAADPLARSGALVRLARVLHTAGRTGESKAVWQRLTTAPAAAAVSGIPVQLAAMLESGDRAGVLAGLRAARWRLSRSQFEYYWQRAAPQETHPPQEALELSEAAATAWQHVVANPEAVPRGQEVLWAASRPWLAIWRAPAENRRAVLLASPGHWLKRAAAQQQQAPVGIEYALVDAQGRTLAGNRQPNSAVRAAVRPAGETKLPWTVYAASVASTSADAFASRERYLLTGMAIMVAFLLLGTYFIARAIRREAEVSRMQSNFVSAVSHEFRSPLTSLRQLSEMLAFGRQPSEERRQLYYETLVRETTRLQRVVEALLTFGQLESGARQFRFQRIDVGDAVRQSLTEFRQEQSSSPDRAIKLLECADECTVDADPEAIGVALRNLLDNAVKYSPEPEPVEVEWSSGNGQVLITVRDRGPGIAEREQRTIFQKFVRGASASERNVKGSGLGLAMVRDIVVAHRGQVSVLSRPGKGSTFTITLPATKGKV